MKRAIMVISFFIHLFTGKTQTIDISKYPAYKGNDLGLKYSPAASSFKIWSPPASEAEIILYAAGEKGAPLSKHPMIKGKEGVWLANLKGDLKGKFYTFRVRINGKWSNEVPDPYVKTVGVNGKRGMIIDLKKTNPAGWEKDKSPAFRAATDAVIYELHVRDASIAANSGIRNKGKFIGLTEKGTRGPDGVFTGLDHLKELGITHVHLLPSYDFYSIDETKPDKPQYNWGYDPLNYNVPEGSYSTNSDNGVTRIKEFKQLVKTFHENGLRVIMDVVYNHTMLTEDSYFNQLVPGYYYRQTPDGKFSNATACNNETASERAMMRKFMLESVRYWVQEYHIDGFRFDLMGVHDIETMNLISKELHDIRPDILLYGEGWTAGASPLPDAERALKANAAKLDRIAVFSDDIRDGIKGSVFEHNDKGFASGKPGMEESIKFGIVAACKHPQVDYSKVNYSKAPYAAGPYNTVTYAECHDNHVLWDKLAISAKGTTEAQRRNMHKLALSVVLTSQGISFLHAGTEFLRSKKGNENSYNAGDSINAIDWSLKAKNKDVVDHVKELISIRKTHPAFRMATSKDIERNIIFLVNLPEGVIAYTINGEAVGDSWEKIMVIFNGSGNDHTYQLPAGEWKYALEPAKENNGPSPSVRHTVAGEKIGLKPFSCSIFYIEK
ncbi:MAG: type I pullulanase [Chitinophagaceae bacterium]|nr:type I pullulanase [Chitinophagaceae bacterium]